VLDAFSVETLAGDVDDEEVADVELDDALVLVVVVAEVN